MMNFMQMFNIRKLPPEAYVGVIACLCYSAFSMSTTLTNKILFQFFHFPYPLVLLLYQNVFTLVLCLAARYFGFIQFPGLQKEVVKDWIPVNILFILMLSTGSYALRILSIPMVTIFKNISTCLVTFGDYALFGQDVTSGIFASVIIMVVASVVAGFNDMAFDVNGYMWMIMNTFVTAAYVLYMRYAMRKTRLSEYGAVYYNNLLAIPFLLPVLYASGEMQGITTYDSSNYTNSFLMMVFLCGVSGFLISVCSFWAVKATSATTYSIVGTLNKIPLTIIGFLFFGAPTNLTGTISIAIGLAGGILYTWEKQRKDHTLPVVNPERKQ
jgi:GDP-mannose transporter